MLGIIYKTTDITPLKPQYLHGHAMRKGKSEGVHDALEAVVCWIRVDGVRNLFINGDMIGWDYDFVHEFKKRIMDKCDVAYDHIVLSATHTHSGPVIKAYDKESLPDDEYVREVMDKLVDTALDIYDKEEEVSKVIYSKGESRGYYGYRFG